MLNPIEELFLTQYFLLEVVLGDHLKDAEGAFLTLADAFCISEEKAHRLFEYVTNPDVRQISTERDFFRFKRIQKYLAMSQNETSNGESELDQLINIKGNTISMAMNHGLKCNSDTTTDIYRNILVKSELGDIPVVRLRGLMKCQGIFFDKNPAEGIEDLSATALWGDITGLMLALYYDKENRCQNFDYLLASAKASPYESVLEKVADKYGLTMHHNPRCPYEFGILKKAFARGILKHDTFDAAYAKVLMSASLDKKEKETLILSCGKEQIGKIDDLPLLISKHEFLPFDGSSFDKLTVKRPYEVTQILKQTNNMDLRTLDDYKPLCLSSSSGFALSMYKRLIPASKQVHIETIDAASLASQDIAENDEQNLFVRLCRPDSLNVYFIVCQGKVNSQVIEAIQNFLQTPKRKKFRLNHPCVTLNLSEIVPVVFCDTDNVKHFRRFCEMIQLQPIQDDEKLEAVQHIIDEKKKSYRLTGLSMDDELNKRIPAIDLDEFEAAIDAAIRNNRADKILLTYPMISEYIVGRKQANTYGFAKALNHEHE